MLLTEGKQDLAFLNIVVEIYHTSFVCPLALTYIIVIIVPVNCQCAAGVDV